MKLLKPRYLHPQWLTIGDPN